DRMGEVLREAMQEDRDLVELFEEFVRESVLVSHKRVYVLRNSELDATQLAPALPDGISTSYLSAHAPRRTASTLSYYLGETTFRKATIHTFLASRPARRTEEIDREALTEEAREQYRDAEIVA